MPLGLFRRRRFATINLSTLLIYGAAYTMGYLLGLFLQNVLGYTATAAGLIGLPSALFIALLSARIGGISGRIGSRPFLIAGPVLMAAGLAWLSRIPATSEPWRFTLGDPSTYLPPASTLVDVLPYVLLWGFGFVLVVAPLTATLMSSIPVQNAATGSAINNAISRVGQPLLSAVIFVAISGTFYAALAGAAPGVDPADPALRAMVQPLNPPAARRAARRRRRRASRPRSTRSTSPSSSAAPCSWAAPWPTGSACGARRAAPALATAEATAAEGPGAGRG